MGNIRTIQATFQAGQIDPKAIGRSDIDLFSQSLKDGTNWRMTSTGAIERRAGSRFLADIGSEVRLLPFEFNETSLYIIALEPGLVTVYTTAGVVVGTPLTASDITSANLYEISWVQSGDFMFLAWPDFSTYEIQRTGPSSFTIGRYTYDLNNNLVKQMPFTKYGLSNTTVTVTGAGPTFTMTSNQNHFTAAYLTEAVQIKVFDGTEWWTYETTGYTDAKNISVIQLEIVGAPAGGYPISPTRQFKEEATNAIFGYPGAVAFHAGRLWFGGFKSLPAHLAASRIGLFWNFDVGDATADDAIFAPVDSDRINRIRHIISGQHLQVFSDLSEMHISEEEGAPIAPTSVAIRTSTRYGASFVKPVVFDDATLFVQSKGKVIREYLWNSLNRGYTSSPISLLTRNIITNIKECCIDYGGEDGPEQYCYFLNNDGSMAAYHALRSEKINGFFHVVTDGEYISSVVVGGVHYVLVKRTIDGVDQYWLEKFDITVKMDGVIEKTSGTPTDVFTGITQYANHTVSVTSENNSYYLGEFLIDGAGVLDISATGFTASQIFVGLNYTARAETLPINFGLANGPSDQMPKRLVSVFARVDSSYDFTLNDWTFTPRLMTDPVNGAPSKFTGIVRSFTLGAAFDRTITLISDIPLDCTLLNLGAEVGF